MTRTPALFAASACLAALALTGCSSGSTGTSASTSGGAATPTTVPTSSDLSSSGAGAGASSSVSSAASGASSAASSVADRLTAIRDCLQRANLPMPTSTDARGLVSEIPKLIQDPRVRQALQNCKVSLTG